MTALYLPLEEWLDFGGWPLGSLASEGGIGGIFVTPPTVDDSGSAKFGLLSSRSLVLSIPGLDFISIALEPVGGVTERTITITPAPLSLTFGVPVSIRIDSKVLRPIKPGTKEPDLDATSLDIPLGPVEFTIDGEGNLDIGLPSSLTIPPCSIGSTGVILEIKKLRWVTPATAEDELPEGTPSGFTGLYMDDVSVEIPQLPKAAEKLKMDDVFIGTGGFSGKVTPSDLELKWDEEKKEFTGPMTGELFGFKGGLSKVALEFKQNALVGCDITGDVLVPYLDERIGLTLGLDGSGSLTATAGVPTSTSGEKPTSPEDGYLLHLDVGDFMKLDVDSLRFEAPAGGLPTLEISGRVDLTVAGLECDPIDLKKLRIANDGNVAIDGGWIDLDTGTAASYFGFPLELTRIGFGSESKDRRWVGLNGGVKLAEGLPPGVSVEGLRVSWNPKVADRKPISVSLDGVGVQLTIPGAFGFRGAVAFFDDKRGQGFAGRIELGLEALEVAVDANLVVARKDSVTYFYIELSMDIPSGIPLLSTGAAIYGFQGLVAGNYAPDRQPDESWYHGWYKRPPVGVTDVAKWRAQTGSWAVGVGTTLGSAPDSGFSFAAKALLIVVGPGPQILFQGKGNILRERMSSTEHDKEGSFEALLVLDVPAKTFQANLAANYEEKGLLDLRGSAEVAMSWAKPQPPGFWHVFLGEKSPIERRWRADLFGIFTANAWFQIWRDRLNLGGWIGFGGEWWFGPLHARLRATIDGEVDVNLDPRQFDGYLQLVGEGGVDVFGFGFDIAAWARVEVKAPKPRYVALAIRIAVSIDLWLFEFSFEGDLALSWGDPNQSPDRVKPVIDKISLEHMKVAGELQQAYPPDVRPVITFKRPVRDLAQAGAPTNPAWPDPDHVPPARFSYRLAHVAITNLDTQKVVWAAGVATAGQSTLTLLGSPELQGVTGGEVELIGDGGKRYEVTGGGSGSLSVSGSLPAGTRAYHFSAKPPKATIQITSAARAELGTVAAEFTTSSTFAGNAFAGGRLVTTTGAWVIVSSTEKSLRLRGLDVPAAGPATITGPGVSALAGNWLPVSDEVPPAQTTLMMGAKTPYARFRHNDVTTLQAFSIADSPAYGCGPRRAEERTCLDFDDFPPGLLTGSFSTEKLSGFVYGAVSVAVTDAPGHHVLRVGWPVGGVPDAPGRPAVPDSVTFQFDPPVNGVALEFSKGGTGRIGARRHKKAIAASPIPGKPELVEFQGEIDEIEVAGSASLARVCTLPAWARVLFENPKFRQDSTGRHAFGSIEVESEGRMVIEKRMLWVRSPASGRSGVQGLSKQVPPLTIHFPGPVTRANVKLGAAAKIAAYAGSTLVAEDLGSAGEDIMFRPAGWLDRIVITAAPGIYVSRVCYDVGEFGSRRQEEAAWLPSVERSIEALYRTDPILPPGNYRLDVAAVVANTGAGTDPTNEVAPQLPADTLSQTFEIVWPPGTNGAFGDGPLKDLSLYVAETVPEPGGRAHYRAHDVRVTFNESYVSQMFLLATKPLTMGVTDSNGADRRAGGVNLWEVDPEVSLSTFEAEWMKTLHGDGTNACVGVDLIKVPSDDIVLACGPALGSSELHAGELRADQKTIFRFEFVTSRFTNFTQHIATFDGRCRKTTTAAIGRKILPTVAASIKAARDALDTALTELTRARQEVMKQGVPKSGIDAYFAARTRVKDARRQLQGAWSEAFSAVQASYTTTPVPGRAPLPPNVEISRLPNALLIQSPEPLHFERVDVTVSGSAIIPLSRRKIDFSAEGLAPDAGDFSYGGSKWNTNNELRVVNGALEPRRSPPSPSPWELYVTTPRCRSATLVVRIAEGGSGTVLAWEPQPGSEEVKLTPNADGSPVVVNVSLPSMEQLRLRGTRLALESVTFVETFLPRPPEGDVRLLAATLPRSSSDDSHSVDVIGFRDVKLDGWTIRWSDATSPGAAADYYQFGSNSDLPEGRIARVFGGLTEGTTDVAGVDAYYGAGSGAPSPGGSVFQLVDPENRVRSELAVLGDSFYTPVPNLLTIPDGDGARALLVSTSGTPPAGHWRVGLKFERDAGAGLPVRSVGGDTTAETASLYFTLE